MDDKAIKPRLVRCPKCMRVLLETGDLPVYQCGGCGATLIAKKYKDRVNVGSSEALGNNAPQKSEHGSEDQELASSKRKIICSTEVHERVEPGYSANDSSQSRRITTEIPSSGDVTCREEEESSSEAEESRKEDQDIVRGCNNESLTAEIPSSCSITYRDEEDLLSEIGESMKADENNVRSCNDGSTTEIPSSGDLTYGQEEDLSKAGESRKRDQNNERGYSNEGLTSETPWGNLIFHEEEESLSEAGESREAYRNNGRGSSALNNARECSNESSRSRRVTTESPCSGDLTCREEDDSLSEGGESRKAYRNNGRGSTSRTPSPEKRQLSGGSSSISAYNIPAAEKVLSEVNISVVNEQMRKYDKAHAADYRRSTDTVETTELTQDSSIISAEDMVDNSLCDRLQSVLKPQTTRSHYAYDGSVSSCDISDDQVSDQPVHLHARFLHEPQMAVAFVSPKRRQVREGMKANNKNTSTAGVQHQETKLPLISLNEKNGAAAVGDNVGHNQDEVIQPIKYQIQLQKEVSSHYSEDYHTVKSWLGLGKEEVPSKEPYLSSGSKNGGPSDYRDDEYLRRASLYPPSSLEFIEHNQIELLRKVDELRKQLNRSYTDNGKTSRGFPIIGAQQKKQWSSYYNHSMPEQDTIQRYDAYYPLRPREAYRTRSSIPHQHRYSNTLVSGAGDMHQANCSCSYCGRAPNMCYNEMLYRARPIRMCCSPHSSSPSSSQRHLHSHYPLRGCIAQEQPHEQKDIDRALEKLQYREQRQSIKRHCLPIAGAAPFIICYSCSGLLQLPGDFLISSNRRNRLKCSSCSKVLLFSLHRRTHLVPYASNSDVPPVSTSTSMSNVASNSHPNDPQGHRVACSEDCGTSTDGEHVSLAPGFFHHQSNSVDKRKISSSYSKPTEERRKLSIFNQSRNKQKNSKEASDCASSSSPPQAKREKPLLGTDGLPLHRLLGYSSARELLHSPGE